MKVSILICLSVLFQINTLKSQLFGEKQKFTQADTLRGKLLPMRTCYDVTYYNLHLRVEPEKKSIKGHNEIHFKALRNFNGFQIDLFKNMSIDKIMFRGGEIAFRRLHNAVLVQFNDMIEIETQDYITVYFHGKPIEAKRAPWDGGFVWEKDDNDNHWIGVACQGIGASLWWPNKDHLSDEPDSMMITCEVPDGLRFVGNGQARGEKKLVDGFTSFSWFVSYPINNYNVTLNIGDYAEFNEIYTSPEDGEKLNLDYYVLPENLERAKIHFQQVIPMMECYEKYFGKYPFWDDGYALVETPYLGMEHQGAVAYGNEYKTGYLGRHLAGIDFDYIIIHESGHEWWGNSVSCNDIADLWIHEGFCTYSEAVYVECTMGYEKAMEYINDKKSHIGNFSPIIGKRDVNHEGSGDMYSKGMLFLNSLRHIIQDDELWWEIIYEIASKKFKIKNVDSKEIENFIDEKVELELAPIFDQYLRNAKIPALVYKMEKVAKKQHKVSLKWKTDVEDFEMPVKLSLGGGEESWELISSKEWRELEVFTKKPPVVNVRDDLVYIKVEKY